MVTALLATCAVYAATCLVVHLAYRGVLYPAPAAVNLEVPEGATRVGLTAKDGVAVNAFVFAGGKDAWTVVYFHGNGERAEDNVEKARALVERGYTVVLAEYRGYGVSSKSGTPTEAGLYNDAAAVLDSLPARDVVLWGTSLGSGVAAEMAHRGYGRALVLATPYTSIRAMASKIAPIFPMTLLIGDVFDTLAKAPGIRIPTIVYHGDADELIPFRMGATVAQAIPGARFLPIEGGHHNDLMRRAGAQILDEIARLAAAR